MGFLSRILGKSKKKHGHDLIKKNEQFIIEALKKFDNVQVVEIGSQRKAGSTKYLSKLSNRLNYQFYTVDLNKETTQAAHSIVTRENPAFQAINDYGEQFLARFNKDIHLVYLDAFDIDGDWHSKDLRDWYQSVGSDLNNENCWKMHLECAEAIVKFMVKDGFVAFDDVNPVDENDQLIFKNASEDHPKWSGKGKTAIPYLLANGFKLKDHQRGTALFQRME